MIWTLALRLICVFGLLFVWPHYDENPVIIIIVALLCLIFIFIIGDDQIIVYEDSVKQTTNSLWDLLTNSKGTTYKIKDIKCAYLQKHSSNSEKAIALLLASALPVNSINRDKTYPIYFELVDGREVKFETNLTGNQMKKVVDSVNYLIKQGCR